MTAMALQLCAMAPPSEDVKPAPRATMQKADAGIADERFAWYVWVYEQWLFNEGIFVGSESGRSRTASVGRSTSSTDSDAMYLGVCRRCAEAFDALLNDLAMPYRIAFQVRHCDIADVMHFREPKDQRYATACLTLRIGLRRRGFE